MCVCACACVCCVLLSFFWFGFGSCCADVYAICKWLENFFCSSVVFRYWRLEDPHLLYINALHVYAYRCVCTSPKLYNVFVVVGRICFCCCFWLFFFLFVCYSSLQFFFISLFFLFVFATSNVVSHISRKKQYYVGIILSHFHRNCNFDNLCKATDLKWLFLLDCNSFSAERMRNVCFHHQGNTIIFRI